MKGLVWGQQQQQQHLHAACTHQRQRQQCVRQRQQRQHSKIVVAAAAQQEQHQFSSPSSPLHSDLHQQQEQQHAAADTFLASAQGVSPQQQQHHHQQPAAAADTNRRGRLLIKQPRQDDLQQALPGSLHQLRGPSQHLQRGTSNSSPQQQQQPWRQQSTRDKNLSFSGALRRTKNLDQLLEELLPNPQWGQGLCDLDGVSVVGALVWLVKSKEWQRLQEQGSAGQQQWRQKQAGLRYIQALLDRAEELVLAQTSSSSSGGSAANSAAAAAVGPRPPLIRPAELANLIYVTSKLQQQRPQLLAAAAAGVHLDLYACSVVELNRLIWGLAHARVNPGDAWLLDFCKAAQAKLPDCSPSLLAVLVYGPARLGYRPPDVWIAAWLEASVPQLGLMSPQQLANAAWGLSCFRFQAPTGWLDAFYAATSASMTQQAPQGISQLAIALVTLTGGQCPPEQWTQQLLDTAQLLLPQLELLQLCNLGWALANWQLQPQEEWMAAWVEASVPLLPMATPVDLSVLLWSCYKLSYVPPQSWLEAWFASTAASLPRCEALQLATMSKVLGEWGLVPTPGFSIDFWRATKSRFSEFTAYQLSVLLWGLGQARRAVPTSWAAALMVNFTQQLPEADPGDVCRFIGALSRVAVKPRGAAHWVANTPAVQQQLQQVVAWLIPQMASVEPDWLMQVVPGLVKLRCGLDAASIQGLNDAAARMDERLAPAQRKTLAKSFTVLRELSQQQQQQQQHTGAQQQQQQLGAGRRRQPQQPVSSSAQEDAGAWLPLQQQSSSEYFV